MRVTARADAGACCTRETDEGKRARAGSRHAQRTCRETSRARAGEQHVRLRAHTRCAESPASAARSTAAPSPACSPSHRAAGCALGAPGTLTSSRSPGDHPPPPQPRACASRVDIPHGAVDGRGRDPAEAPTAGPCSKFKVFVVRISFDLQAWCQQQPVRTAGGWEGKVVRGARAWRRLACWRESARVGVGGGRPRSGVRWRRRAALRLRALRVGCGSGVVERERGCGVGNAGPPRVLRSGLGRIRRAEFDAPVAPCPTPPTQVTCTMVYGNCAPSHKVRCHRARRLSRAAERWRAPI